MQLSKAARKAKHSRLQRSLLALRRAADQAQDIADASEGFLQESQVCFAALQCNFSSVFTMAPSDKVLWHLRFDAYLCA